MDNIETSRKHKLIILAFLTGVVVLLMGCSLFSVDYWVSRSRLDTGGETVPDDGAGVSSQLSGEDCLNSPGDTPCSMETCMVPADQFSAKYDNTVELYGKANPNNFSCCADYQFTNNSNVELMVFEHMVIEDDRWNTTLYSTNGTNDHCSNYYAQHEGEITYWKGITEIVVIYANPHCDWITVNEPGFKNFVVPITGLCAPQ